MSNEYNIDDKTEIILMKLSYDTILLRDELVRNNLDNGIYMKRYC